jgi:cyanate lyase
MNRSEVTELIATARREKGLTFSALAEEAGADRVRLTAALFGQHPLERDQAEKVGSLLGLPDEAVALLQEIPMRGTFATLPPSDPTIYRLYEVLQVYGQTIKALVHEDFGDGIMSAISFNLAVERGEAEDGPRVRIVLDGKFLPYKW